MKKITLIGLILLTASILSAQKNVKGTHFTAFELNYKKDKINFVVADTNLSISKPILLFCQGSLPVPLFIDSGTDEKGNKHIFPTALSNFDKGKLNKYFHVVVISMPYTPLVVDVRKLNYRYCYISDTSKQHSFDVNYLKADNVKNYVERANKVIRFVLKQKWAKGKKIAIAGHSQGARIAVNVAAENNKVNKIGLFGYNPLNRMTERIFKARRNAAEGKISWKEADSICQYNYEFMRELQNPDNLIKYPTWVAWKSFSKGSLDLVVKLKQPIYIAYGSNDMGAQFCDYLPLYFIENNKANFTLKRYGGLNHNFFPMKHQKPDYKNGRWKEVMNLFVDWLIDGIKLN